MGAAAPLLSFLPPLKARQHLDDCAFDLFAIFVFDENVALFADAAVFRRGEGVLDGHEGELDGVVEAGKALVAGDRAGVWEELAI